LGSNPEDRYIRNFLVSKGFRLHKEAIRPNTAKRGLAKLCLKSLWGKLTERNNRTKSKMISVPHEIYIFLATPGIEVEKLLLPAMT